MEDTDAQRATFTHGSENYEISFEVVTPSKAAEYLSLNVRNRNLTEGQLQALQQSLRKGDWVVNGATLVFDSEGNLSDGQHRLTACIRANAPLPTFVIRGVEPLHAQDTTDNTRRRTLAGQLQIRGERNSRALASALVMYERLINVGELRSVGQQTTVTEGLRLLEEHPAMRDSVRVGNRGKDSPLRYPAGLAGALHYRFCELLSEEDADVFFARLWDGNELSPGDPVFTLRERLLSEAARAAAKGKMTYRYRGALTIKAWNAWIRGQEVRQIMWRPGGARAEQFPVIRGAEDIGA